MLEWRRVSAGLFGKFVDSSAQSGREGILAGLPANDESRKYCLFLRSEDLVLAGKILNGILAGTQGD